MSHKRTLVMSIAGTIGTLALVPVLAGTSIGPSSVTVESLTASNLQASTEISGGATKSLVLQTQEAIGAIGGDIIVEAANGTPPLFGPFSPADGGQIFLYAGSGSPELGGAAGGNGGNLYLTAGDGGDDDGVGAGTTGFGGSIVLQPGRAGQEAGGGGGVGLDGVILLASHDGTTQLTVLQDLVQVNEMLGLPVRPDQPSCSSSERGSMYLQTNGATADGVCVCVDTGGSAFGWVDLSGGGGCP